MFLPPPGDCNLPVSTDPAVLSVPDLFDSGKECARPFVQRSTLHVCRARVTQPLKLLSIHDLEPGDSENGAYRRRIQDGQPLNHEVLGFLEHPPVPAEGDAQLAALEISKHGLPPPGTVAS